MVAACILALILLGSGFAALTAEPPSTLAAPAESHALLASTNTYSVFLPLTLRSFSTELCPNDPFFQSSWALEAISAPQAWFLSCGCDTVVIAVLDTGVDLDHPDLAGKILTGIDLDLVNDDSTAEDDYGHGTHVAGIAAAATDNGQGVAGLGWETSILPIKILDDNGAGDAAALAEGIIYAADNGAAVINMSLGAEVSFCPTFVQDAVDYAYGMGVVLVAAGGNTSSATDFFPANCDHVMGVAATEADGDVAGYSTIGNHVNVAAPGSGIYSTYMDGGYGYKTGTSMAAPYVAGLASLIYARYPEYTPDQVVSAILDNADDIGSPGWDPSSGCGLINAFQSLASGAAAPYPEFLGLSTWGTGERVAEPDPAAEFVPGEVIVSYLPGVKAERVSAQYGANSEHVPSLGIWRLQTWPGEELILLAELRSNPAVAQADLNYMITAR